MEQKNEKNFIIIIIIIIIFAIIINIIIMIKLNNPFIIGNYAGEHYFCDRVDESNELIDNILNNRNTVLVSERRLGKTGLICHCLEQKTIVKNYNIFSFDIYFTNTLQEFVYVFGKEITKKLKPKGKKFLEKFLNIFTSLRGNFKIDAITGEPSFELSIGDIVSPETTLDEIFSYLNNSEKPCIVAIDEFQQIGKYSESNVEALLRTKIQHCPNCTFIFAGSEKDMLINMFNSAAKPFYQSATFMQLGKIDFDKYKDFAIGLFKEGKKDISEELISLAYSKADGVTLYIQMIMNELYSITPKNAQVTQQLFDLSFDILLKKQSFMYVNILSDISIRQKELLFAIAKEDEATKLTSEKFINEHGMKSSSSIQSSLKGLIDKRIVNKEKDCYVISDRLFRWWLLTI